MFLSVPRTLTLRLGIPLPRTLTRGPRISPAMSVHLRTHAFAGNPLRSKLARPADTCSPGSALETLKSLLAAGADEGSSPGFKVLAFRKGRPLARSLEPVSDTPPRWRLGWVSPYKFKDSSVDDFVYLGSGSEEDADTVYWAIDVSSSSSSSSGVGLGGGGDDGLCFVELRTLMVATDWADADVVGELAIAGHARALLEWHNVSRFCGHCGASTVPIDAGQRKQCTNESCKKRIYPRVDPVVIMLVIDKANDRALLSRQSRFVPRMWSCLAGFIEPGESLEEAVRRETWEETGIEVGDVVYHSSQPWPGIFLCSKFLFAHFIAGMHDQYFNSMLSQKSLFPKNQINGQSQEIA